MYSPRFWWTFTVIYIIFGIFYALTLKDKIINMSYDERWTLFARDPDNNFIKEFCEDIGSIDTKSGKCTNNECCTRIIVRSLSDDMVRILVWKYSSFFERLIYFPNLSYSELMKKYKDSLKN